MAFQRYLRQLDDREEGEQPMAYVARQRLGGVEHGLPYSVDVPHRVDDRWDGTAPPEVSVSLRRPPRPTTQRVHPIWVPAKDPHYDKHHAPPEIVPHSHISTEVDRFHLDAAPRVDDHLDPAIEARLSHGRRSYRRGSLIMRAMRLMAVGDGRRLATEASTNE